MAKRSIKALQNKIDTESSNGGASTNSFYYPHWVLPKDGVTKVRFLEDPDLDNELIFYTEYKEHVLNMGDDEVVRVPCLKNGNIKNPCPICDLSRKYYDNDDKKNGKYYYRDLYLLLRGIVTKDGLEYKEGDTPATGTIKAFRFSYQLATALKAALGQFEEGDEPWSLDNGFDFQIVKTVNKTPDGDQSKYDAGSTFVRKESSIDEEWREGTESIEPLSALIPEIPSYDEAVAILQRHLKSLNGELGGDDGDDGDDGSRNESVDDIEAKIAKQRAKKREEKMEAEVKSVDDSQEDDSSTSVDETVKEDDSDSPLAGLDIDDDDDIDIISKLKS